MRCSPRGEGPSPSGLPSVLPSGSSNPHALTLGDAGYTACVVLHVTCGSNPHALTLGDAGAASRNLACLRQNLVAEVYGSRTHPSTLRRRCNGFEVRRMLSAPIRRYPQP